MKVGLDPGRLGMTCGCVAERRFCGLGKMPHPNTLAAAPTHYISNAVECRAADAILFDLHSPSPIRLELTLDVIEDPCLELTACLR